MENLGERMVYLMKRKGLNPNKLGVLSSIHPSTIKNYVENKGKPDNLKLDKIAEVLGISKDWLKYGIGEMELSEYDKKEYLSKVEESSSNYGPELITKENPAQKREGNDIGAVNRLAKMLDDAYDEIKRLREINAYRPEDYSKYLEQKKPS